MNIAYEQIEELKEYAEYEGTEWGEMIMALAQVMSYADYVSDEFRGVLFNEIARQHEWAKEELVITEYEETFKRTVRSVGQR